MNTEPETNFFDVNDRTALVCIDHQHYQTMIVPQLLDLDYKVHLGLFAEDVLLKLDTYNYNLVVIYENFKGTNLATNPILPEMVKRPAPLRRENFVILLTHRVTTNDAMSAFV